MNYISFKIAQGSFKVLFQFIFYFFMMNLIAFIASFVFFVIFAKLVDLLGKQRHSHGLWNFLFQDKQVYLRNVLSRQDDHLK